MKQRFKVRELWLFLPILLMGAVALYLGRVEQASKPGASGMYLSGFEVEAASGQAQEQGVTHLVTVKIAHPWPKPKWWGDAFDQNLRLDPRHPQVPGVVTLNWPHEKLTGNGAVFTVEGAPDKIIWPRDGSNMNAWPNFVDGEYLFRYDLRATQLPDTPRAVDFSGVFQLGNSQPLTVARVVRKAGEKLAAKIDKNPGAQLVSADAMPFLATQTRNSKGLPTTELDCRVHLIVRPTQAAPNPPGKHSMSVNALEVGDEAGEIYLDQKPVGFGFGYGGQSDDDEKQLKPDEILNIIVVHLDTAIATSGRLTLRGKISVDEHWPVPFQVQLPPRASAITSFLEWPRWTRPTKAAP